MKSDSPFDSTIHASLLTMRQVLEQALSDILLSLDHSQRHERNMAIGALVPVEDLLQQAIDLYRAVIQIHRFKQ